MKREFDSTQVWQEIEGFDKSDFREVFLIYRKSKLGLKSGKRLKLGCSRWVFSIFLE
jgi:hypothetical protein